MESPPITEPYIGSAPLTLDILPTEILLTIFDYLTPSTLYLSLRGVCKRFHYLLSREQYYRGIFKKKLQFAKLEFPLLSYYGLEEGCHNSVNNTALDPDDIHVNEATWTDISVRTSIRENLFGSDGIQRYKYVHYNPTHTGAVDAVLFIGDGTKFISGGRDRLLCVWDLKGSVPIGFRPNAHDGWIWDLKRYQPNTFFSCGWDRAIKHWDVTNDFRLVQKIPAGRALCLDTKNWVMAAGLQNGTVIFRDPRVDSNPSLDPKVLLHRGAITGIRLWKSYVVSVGEDRKMTVYDIRNHNILVQKYVNCFRNSCPRSIAVYRDLLHVGDANGYLSIFNLNSGLTPILYSKVGQERGLNALCPSLEGITIGTGDVGLRFVVPSVPVKVIGDHIISGEVTSIDVNKNIIVAGCTNPASNVHVFTANLETKPSIEEF